MEAEKNSLIQTQLPATVFIDSLPQKSPQNSSKNSKSDYSTIKIKLFKASGYIYLIPII